LESDLFEVSSSVAIFECVAKFFDDLGQFLDMSTQLFDPFVLLVFVLLQGTNELIEIRLTELFVFLTVFVVRQVTSFDVFGKFLSMLSDKVSGLFQACCHKVFRSSVEMFDGRVGVFNPVSFCTATLTARLFALTLATKCLFKFLNLSSQSSFELGGFFPLTRFGKFRDPSPHLPDFNPETRDTFLSQSLETLPFARGLFAFLIATSTLRNPLFEFLNLSREPTFQLSGLFTLA